MASAKKTIRDLIETPLNKARTKVYGILDQSNAEEHEYLRRMVASLARTVMLKNDTVSAADLETFRVLWGQELSAGEVDHMILLIQSGVFFTLDEAAEILTMVGSVERLRLLKALVTLGASTDTLETNREFFSELALRMGISVPDLEEMESAALTKAEKRKKLLRSGAGIIASLVVIAVFILTATLLKSVIFGLILAYIMLPVEKYFERKIQQPKGIFGRFFGSLSNLIRPLKRAGRAISGRRMVEQLSAGELAARERKTLVNRAVSLAGMVLLLVFLSVSALLVFVSLGYLDNLKNSVSRWTQAPHGQMVQSVMVTPSTEPGSTDDGELSSRESAIETTPLERNSWLQFFENARIYLEEHRSKFESIPWVRALIDEFSYALKDPEAQRQLIRLVAKQTGGIFSFSASLLGAIFSFLLDVLLTAFFFLLFLGKLAEFSLDNSRKNQTASSYIVRTIFSGHWLPNATEEGIVEAERIIGEIIHKLKVWLRGYLSLILVDFSVYSTVFYFLNVPYFLILGALAGCALLLPFIGPVVSASVTILVTLAVGGSSVSVMQILGIVAIYLIHNGITEQFILYPSVIGESLGLTTLETIIVVLLGGIFAGITGMIFAIPAAAMLKYLVPQIYNCWK